MRRLLKWTGIAFGIVIGLLIPIIVGGFVYERIARSRDADNYPAPGQLIDVGGRNMHIMCAGNGSPTVILEAGGASSSAQYFEVQRQISEFARVCVYDRAGFGWSDENPGELSFEAGAQDLKTLISNGNIPGPYILVGHSKGSLYSRTYARLYPDDVVGMLLIDANEEEHMRANLELLKELTASTLVPRLLSNIGVVRLLIRFAPKSIGIPDNIPDAGRSELFAELARTAFWTAGAREQEAFDLTPDEMWIAGGFGQLGNVPLIVISHGIPFTGGMSVLEQGWTEAQERLAELSSDSELLVAEHSGHGIMWDEPAVVVDAVERLVSKAKAISPDSARK